MAAPRRFDHDECRRRHAAGESTYALAARYGVSQPSIYLAVNAAYRARQATRASAWQRDGRCPDCGGQATRTGRAQHRCQACAAKRAATTVRPAELLCVMCHEWKPDRAFPKNHSRTARRGRHHQCRGCNTASKRAWRERNKVPCSHGCGTLVDGKNRSRPDKPPECKPCAMKRIGRERLAA